MEDKSKTTKEQRTRAGILMFGLRDAGADMFLVNVIQNWHSNPMRKLRGLLALTKAGKTARTGQFDLDVLVVDGQRVSWALLDEWGTRGMKEAK
jgi:hypothetical protein